MKICFGDMKRAKFCAFFFVDVSYNLYFILCIFFKFERIESKNVEAGARILIPHMPSN